MLGLGLLIPGAISFVLGLPQWAKTVLLLLLVGAVVYYAGDIHGRSVIQSRWDVAEKAALKIGKDARDEANAAIPALTPGEVAADSAIAPRGKPCVMRDKWDRDCKANTVRAK